ncbi:TetR/AcrR family transcriptional regulator [Alteromonas sp. HB246098]
MNSTNVSGENRFTRKKHKTRLKLLTVATELIARKGFETLTADDIAEGADVGRRTFYNYFEGKVDCITEAVRVRYEAYAQAHTEQLSQVLIESHADSADVVARMANAMFNSIATDPITEKLTAYPHILNNAITESQRDFLTANIANGVISGRFQPVASPEIAEPITSWGFIGLVIASIHRQSQVPDGMEWARFVLTMLGLSHHEIDALNIFQEL